LDSFALTSECPNLNYAQLDSFARPWVFVNQKYVAQLGITAWPVPKPMIQRTSQVYVPTVDGHQIRPIMHDHMDTEAMKIMLGYVRLKLV
jgi:hypothetical protein